MTNIQICQIMVQILMGLEYTHSKETIHRDISADNILFFAEQGQFKLADFGVATFGTTVNYGGKVDYMAPEVKEPKHYNYKADIWSVGVVLYELCTYKRKYKDEVLSAFRTANKPTEIKLPDDYKELQPIFNKITQYSPHYRPTASEVLKFFLEILGDVNSYQSYMEQMNQLKKEELAKQVKSDVVELLQLLSTQISKNSSEQEQLTQELQQTLKSIDQIVLKSQAQQ
ncbi:serine threonine-protein kinase 24-like [Stylonychia lemnae]|uniref:non-specific serine/threonine protein kinase n=1 Tax=Stylonychia lemnae TaxID=5949 RepID=A0A078AT04_STYLE|nr:serine threonine-protein kinase 24-like [Stylonychia lemnae]|eukprot:CDW84332.1 serine threonine-protein kinase 24-like [Stylonychia lemnae]